jgi:hypothetical protein
MPKLMVANPFFRLKIGRRKTTVLRSIQYRIHRCKNRFSRSGGFFYDSASNPLESVGNLRNVWAAVAISNCDGWVRSYKNLLKSATCSILGKVPWQIAP